MQTVVVKVRGYIVARPIVSQFVAKHVIDTCGTPQATERKIKINSKKIIE